jgi:Spy/CpxP family protein refolding chaperone
VKIWKVIIAVMLIFGAGVVTGGLIVRSLVPRQTAARQSTSILGMPASSNGPISPARQMFVQKVRRELDLTPDQSTQVDDIMRESRKRMNKIYEPVMPEAREETRRVRQEIQAILSPEQKKKFNEVFKRRQHEGGEEHKNNRARGETNAANEPARL